MAEAIFCGIAKSVGVKLGSLVGSCFGLAWGAESERDKLSQTLATVEVVMLDAERDQGTNRELGIWLEGLKHVYSSAQDVLDEYQTNLPSQQQLMQRNTHVMEKVRIFFSSSNPLLFHVKMGYKIMKIRQDLVDIADDKQKYQISQQNLDRKVEVWRETHSYVDASNVIGRYADKEVIVNHLIQPDNDKCVCVIPIIGIGGLGKTELAKCVYNDVRVIKHFDLRRWVCVLEVFEVKKIIRNMLNCEDIVSLQNLIELLHQTLGGKKYLIVLDDVWNEDLIRWRNLMEILNCGVKGCKIVVTTRSPLVASITDPTYTHMLPSLAHKDSFYLLRRWAFGVGRENKYPHLDQIGKDIAKKCGGVPLAVRTLGSLLYMKTDVSEWRSVRDSELWNLEQGESDILPALKLSYNYLPFYLRRCFVTCSMFEKGHEFDDISMVYLWMALGLLDSSDQTDLELEERGKKYVTQLLSRSFFQDFKKSDYEYEESFKMHDLLHDLSTSLTKNDYARLSRDSLDDVFVDNRVKHLSFYNKSLLSMEEFHYSLLKATNLRTIRVGCDSLTATSQYFVNTCITQFKLLRVLDLKMSRFEVLPDSIGHLKYLRYLDLYVGMEFLPNTLCKLQNLQYLRMRNSHQGFEKLPENFGRLINLRYLKVQTNEKCFPGEGIGSLINLRTLIIQRCDYLESLFDYSYERDGGMQRNYPNLRILVIERCLNLKFLPKSLIYLSKLETLKIANCKLLDLPEGSVGNLVSLKVVFIEGLPKLKVFPNWLSHSGVLKKLAIHNCLSMARFPKDLMYPQELIIRYCPKLGIISGGKISNSVFFVIKTRRDVQNLLQSKKE